jgi:hypothetical protein
MQFQMNKAGQLVQNQTNFILYDQRMNLIPKKDVFKNEEGKEIYNGIFTINKIEINTKLEPEENRKNVETRIKGINFLPNNDHPFDQLIVLKTLKIPPKKKR